MTVVSALLCLLAIPVLTTTASNDLTTVPKMAETAAGVVDYSGKGETVEFLDQLFLEMGENDGDRHLQSVCSQDNSLFKDGAWYELDITLSSREPIHCDSSEWANLKTFLERQLDQLNLWRSFNILDLNAHLCWVNPAWTRRLAVLDPKTRAVQEFIDEDDPRFDELLHDEQRRLLGQINIIFHLFYRGGGKCYFCWNDNRDRRRELQPPTTTATTATTTTSSTTAITTATTTTTDDDDENKKLEGDDNNVKKSGNLRGNFQQELTALEWTDTENDELSKKLNEEYGIDTEEQDEEESMEEVDVITTSQDVTAWEEKQYPGENLHEIRSRHLRCGGCFRLDFAKDGRNRPIRGTPYLNTYEYWDSHAVRIRAWGNFGCYRRDRRARIFDTHFRHNNGVPDTDADLGSPNERCGGGPGRGAGGEPYVNGRPNPGKNCDREGNVLILQSGGDPNGKANDCYRGGTLRFDFRYPVTLNSIGLMDMDENIYDIIDIYTENGQRHNHRARGYGDNSVETIEVKVKKVKAVTIKFPHSGAVRFLDFCHDCGDIERLRSVAMNRYYPSAQQRSYENANSADHLADMLPDVSAAISTHLEHRLNDMYRGDRQSCLYGKDVAVYAVLAASTPMQAVNCNRD